MRTLITLIALNLFNALVAQTTPSNSQISTTSLEKPFYFIVPAGPTSEALEKLEKSAKIYFSYNPDILPNTVSNDTWVGISFRQGLDRMLGQNFAYRLRGNHIVIRTLQEGVIINGKQEYAITGYIKDNTTGKAIPFASIYDTTSLKSVLSDRDGYFELTVADTHPKTIGILIPNEKDTYLMVSPLHRIETSISKILNQNVQAILPITHTVIDTLKSNYFWDRQLTEVHEMNQQIQRDLSKKIIKNDDWHKAHSIVQLAINYGSSWPWMPEMQIGIPKIYNRFTFAPGQKGNKLWGVGYGLGTQIGSNNPRGLTIEVLGMGLYPGHVAEIPLMGTLSIMPTFKLGKNVKLIIGPEANAVFTHGIKAPMDGYKLPPNRGLSASFPIRNGREMTAFFSWRVKLVVD